MDSVPAVTEGLIPIELASIVRSDLAVEALLLMTPNVDRSASVCSVAHITNPARGVEL